MPNERLRAVMAAGGWTYASLAAKTEVDPKSIEAGSISAAHRAARQPCWRQKR